jgi:predicted translin family RNA/ssDNA-binding protein
MTEPRRERWLSLLEVATLLKINLSSRSAKRRKVLRLVRDVERRGTSITKRFGNRVYVSTAGLELLFPAHAIALGKLEDSVARIASEQREIKRKLNGHGSRLKKVESGFRDTAEWLAKMQASGWVKNES